MLHFRKKQITDITFKAVTFGWFANGENFLPTCQLVPILILSFFKNGSLKISGRILPKSS